MNQWYFHDAARGRVGPIDADQLRDAWRKREVQADTLAWRAGMAEWQPLSRMAAELGLDAIAPAPHLPPPLPPGVPPVHARPAAHAAPAPRKGMSGCVIALLVAVALAIPVLGILAAVAIPAYQDYTLRAKVAQGVAASQLLQVRIADFHAATGRCPENGDEGFEAPGAYAGDQVAEVRIGSVRKLPCEYEIRFASDAARIDGQTLRFEGMPDEGGGFEWTCTEGSLDARFRPRHCRAPLDGP
ncbi:GYF domain-containing protein [Marilutibacter spongiae]|uniref:DUF4339 domain-containing protein n=1 Tax=Marilutibacter spongiae TaxID=2025720 RepID=A0A7W3TMZ4_9GAMM|nr:GYF domain-containing protein [Lysobacter spongiae]MBB1061323.1 DUF4339 domain-containing protein [Lysobacter spongiae]